MNGPPRGSELKNQSNGFNNGATEVRIGHVVGRSSLLLMKLRIGGNLVQAKDLKPPPRPKRISSAKPDTVNPPDDAKEIDGGRNTKEGEFYCIDPIVTSQHMGSSSSVNQPTLHDGAYIGKASDFLTLRHPPVHQGADSHISHQLCNSSDELVTRTRTSSDKEIVVLQQSPIKLYQHLTFKGTSLPVAATSQNLFKGTSQPFFSSFYSRKGKYDFNSAFSDAESVASNSNLLKPSTIHSGSMKLHQSESSGLLFTSTPSEPMTPLSDFAEKTMPMSGTLQKSNTSGSATGLFHKSKSKVRNSFRNWKLHARNVTSEDKLTGDVLVPSLTVQSQGLYGATLPMPDDIDDSPLNWIPTAQDSVPTVLYPKQISTKAIIPVKIPVLTQPLIGTRRTSSSATSQEGSKEEVTNQSTLSGDENRESLELNFQNVSKKHDICSESSPTQQQRDNFSSSNEFVDMMKDDITTKTPEQETIEILDSVIQCHSKNRFLTNRSFSPVECKQLTDSYCNLKQKYSLQQCERQSQNMLPEQKNLLYSRSPGEELARSQFNLHEQKCSKPNLDMLLRSPPTCDPNLIRSPVEPLTVQSAKLNSDYCHSSFAVTQGKLIPDILTLDSDLQTGIEGSYAAEGKQSLNSENSLSYEVNSFDSSTSFTESQDFITSDDGDVEEVVLNNAAIRKAGWLTLKHLLVSKRRKLEKSAKRKWTKYWVNLKGAHLLFYAISEALTPDELAAPVLIVSTDGSLVQAMPEHTTRSNVLCMSTMHGSAYLLQASSQTEVESWIRHIHNEAAVSHAHQKSGDSEILSRKFIQSSIFQDVDQMRHVIEEDEKMIKMTRLQDSLVSDSKSHRMISDQIQQWEESAERNHVHMFRLHCYLASLDASGQPHPQTAIAASCKSSKQILSAHKCFNVSTLHSLVVTKKLYPSSMRKRSSNPNLKRSGSYCEVTKDYLLSDKSLGSLMKPKKSSLFGSLRGFDTWRGSTISQGKKRSRQRTSAAGIWTAFTSSSSSHSSMKNDVEKLKTSSNGRKNNPLTAIVPPPSGEYDSSPISNNHVFDALSEDERLDKLESYGDSLDSLLLAPPDAWCLPVEYESSSIRVGIPTNQFVTVAMTENMTFHQLLEIVCQRKQLSSNNHYIVAADEVIHGNELLSKAKGLSVQVKKKKQYSIELEKINGSFGFSIRCPKVICYPLVVESVPLGGTANQCGLKSGEEILVANGELTLEMSDADINRVLSADYLRLLIQTTYHDSESECKMWWFQPMESTEKVMSPHSLTPKDREIARIGHLMAVMEEYLQEIVVPPPPIVSKLQPPFIRSRFSVPVTKPNLGKCHGSIEDIIGMLTVPPPNTVSMSGFSSVLTPKHSSGMGIEDEEEGDALVTKLLYEAELVTKMCRQLQSGSGSSSLIGNSQSQASGINDLCYHLNDVEKMWKVLEELVDTEANYVKDLVCLLQRFLQPLHAEGFLASLEMESLLQSAENILSFQKIFFADLFESSSHGSHTSDLAALNRSVLSMTSAFLQHASQFKLYAVFATCHAVAQELIEQTKSASSDIRLFLDARNPKQQHSLSLDSYLIKPIQRVLKYPLLLRELLTLSESLEDIIDTKVRSRLKAALHAMHAVARHINDSQTVHDEFGNDGFRVIMEQAALRSVGSYEGASLSLTNLLCYCATEWLNAPENVMSRTKKGNILEMMVLVFRSVVVLLCRAMKTRDKKRVLTQPELSYNRVSIQDFLYSDVILGLEISVVGKLAGEKNIFELSTIAEVEPRSYKLACNSFESKQRIVKTVQYVVKNCARTICDDAHGQQIDVKAFDCASEIVGNEGTNLNCEFAVEDIPRPLSVTETKKPNYFYLPDTEPGSPSPEPNDRGQSNTIPMTLPLPTYEAAVQNIAQLTNPAALVELRSANSASVKSKSSHRRSGLFITTTPFVNSRPKVANYDKLNQDYAKTLKQENYLGDTELADPVRPRDNNISEERDFNRSQDRVNFSHKFSRSPRYNMVYGVAPYESKM